MHRGRFILILLVAALAALAAGCTRTYGTGQSAGAQPAGARIRLAVLPFHGVSEARGSGMIVADVLANQLYALGKYAVVTPEIVASRLADVDSGTLPPAEIGSLVGAPWLVTGRVTEYTYKSGVGETPVIGVTARLIDASSGAVVWSATRAYTGDGNWFMEDSLARLTVMLCQDLADSLGNFLDTLPAATGAGQPGQTQAGARLTPASAGSK